MPTRRRSGLIVFLVSLAVAAGTLPGPAAGAAPRARATSDQALTVTEQTGFDGIYRTTIGPPNEQVAVGPSDIVEATNGAVEAWRRTAPGGTPELSESDCTLLGIDGFCGDPRALYDPGSGRFFVSAEGTDVLAVAVSATENPAGDWYDLHIPVPADSIDNPRLSITRDTLVLGDNGDDLWDVQKSDLLAATSSPVTARVFHTTIGDDVSNSVDGIISLVAADPSSPVAFVESRGGTDRTALRITTVTGSPAAHDVTLRYTVLHVPYPWADPLPAPQEGGPTRLAPVGFYPYQATVHGGSMWFSMIEPCRPSGDTQTRDCIHLVQVDVSGVVPRFVFETEIGVAGEYFATPAVAVDAQGRAAVVATETGGNMYASVVAIPVRADGTTGVIRVLQPGLVYTQADYFDAVHRLIRWGDHSAAVNDPSDPDRLWLVGEYAKGPDQWGTHVSAVTVDDPSCPGSAPVCQPGTFRPVAPVRLADTRLTAPVPAGGRLVVPVAGRGGVPADGVGTVTATLVATGATAPGYLTAYPAGLPEPPTSTVNYAAGRTTANLVRVPVGLGGAIAVRNHGDRPVQVVLDVTGWDLGGRAGTPGAYTPLPPTRVLDTRSGVGAARAPVSPGGVLRLALAGRAGLPSRGVAAVALNVTVVGPRRAGYLTAYADGTAVPNTSVQNFAAGQTVAGTVIAPVAADGAVDLRNASAGSTDLLADVLGYVAAGTPTADGALTVTRPQRVLDTRSGLGAARHAVAPGATLVLRVPGPASTTLLQLTATDVAASGYVSAWRAGAPAPATSVLDTVAGATVTGLVVVTPDAHGDIEVRNGSRGTVDLVADLVGSFR